MDKNNKISINSGSVTIDTADQAKDETKVAVLLETVLLPSKLKKTIREGFLGKLSDIIKFNATHKYQVPPEMQGKIRHIQEQTDKFRVK